MLYALLLKVHCTDKIYVIKQPTIGGAHINNWNIPIYYALQQYRDSKPIPFHMPGHKLGKGIPSIFANDLLSLDVTEIPGTDNLHFPDGPISEAQKLAADAFGADETFFLVNGSTVGLHVIILTICKPGDKLIVARDCHKSVINGMILAGVTPIYIKPGYHNRFGIPAVIQPSQVEEAMMQNPDAAGVLITRPNYYGICPDIEEIACIVHKYGKILAVDEAHGAHLVFNNSLPRAAMKSGADICVQSAHKTLAALTQGSYLHVRKDRIDTEKLKFYLRMLQTSSPSYIIMTSLDMARAIMEYGGCELLDELKKRIEHLRTSLDSCNGLIMLAENHLEQGRLDWTRITVNTSGLGISGYEAEKVLRANYNIQVEMSDRYNIICIATIADDDEHFGRLGNALMDISHIHERNKPLDDMRIKEPELPVMKIHLKDITRYKGENVALNEAAGRISLGMVTPYPPGIPVICPGEQITDEIVEYLYGILHSGGTVNGVGDKYEVTVVK